MRKGVFVTGIGTGVGKTVVSALLCRHTKADYWKPIQAGDLENTDSMKVGDWTSDLDITIHQEQHRLLEARSPHIAAIMEGITLNPEKFLLPATSSPIVVEGAGGILVPINEDGNSIADLMLKFDLPIVLVSRYYLGSINHTLLSINYIKQMGLSLKAVVFTGEEAPGTKSAILAVCAGVEVYEVPEIQSLSQNELKKYSAVFEGFSF